MSNVIYFNNFPARYETFTLGELYVVKWSSFSKAKEYLCKFIKVTPKGFNLLNMSTNKCIMRRHLYDRKYSGKVIPHSDVKFKVKVSNYMIVNQLPKENTA